MLNLRYWFFDKAVLAGDDHAAHCIGPHDVGIVIDFDAPRRPLPGPKVFGQAAQQIGFG